MKYHGITFQQLRFKFDIMKDDGICTVKENRPITLLIVFLLEYNFTKIKAGN